MAEDTDVEATPGSTTATVGRVQRLPLRQLIQILLAILIVAFVAIGSYKTLTLPSGEGYDPSTWKAFVISGVAQGGIYALIAIGYTLVYGVLRMINFAHGEVFMMGCFVSFFFGLKIRDTDCDFRLIRRATLDQVQLVHTTGVICVELVRKLQDVGARFTEVGVHHYRRTHGKSEFFRVGAIARTLWGLAGLWVQLVVLRQGRQRRADVLSGG